MTMCLYLTENKPTRKGAEKLVTWLKDNHPDCFFVEINVNRKASPPQNGGRYQGRVNAPLSWGDTDRTVDRQTILEAARRLLAG